MNGEAAQNSRFKYPDCAHCAKSQIKPLTFFFGLQITLFAVALLVKNHYLLTPNAK